ncbi:MAG: putative bifunctional diguanylate cyclase/phosphodiesterase [Xanthobacteraceae bacterium]
MLNTTRKNASKRSIMALAALLCFLVGGTWGVIKFTADHLLYNFATLAASNWARYLAESVTDLEQIAAGERPSTASMAFFEGTRRAGQVFRYEIYNRQGYSQLISDQKSVTLVDLAEYNADAARTITLGQPIVDTQEGNSVDLPAFFARAYIPVLINQRPVGVVAAYVDETSARDGIYNDFMVAAALLCLMTAASFGIPAIAWYRRTEEKRLADRRIRYLAHHDALTGLTNRARLNERLEKALALALSTGDSLAIHFLDIDRFKEVNDTLGHDAGDFLLKTIAERLRAVTRIDDIVARLGGDEFVVVQTFVANKAMAEDFAKRLVATMTQPIKFREQEITASMTIGSTIAPADGATPERLFKCADLALYVGKKAGRNCVRFFTPDMDEALQARLRLEKLIRRAVSEGRFELHFQPVFEANNRQLAGFEALVRLPDEDGVLVPPATFIPIAENMRVIDKIGEWVLRNACQTAVDWPKNLTVAVNLSAEQFLAGSVSEMVAGVLAETGFDPHRLELEITESLLIGDSEGTLAELRKLKAAGVSIVMDDFGTGYSSLNYLWRFPFDKIKIDRSFMQGLEGTSQDAALVVRTIIALGRELNMRVTVEGVETASQASFVSATDADQVQGFFFGRPVPASELPAQLAKGLYDRVFAQAKTPVDEPPHKLRAIT